MNVKHRVPGIISGVVLYASVIVVHFQVPAPLIK